jgi:hypothetical protein
MAGASLEPAHCNCPACGGDVTIDTRTVALQCGHCGHKFFLESSEADQATALEEPEASDELDGNRIHQQMTLVRSAYRSRSYAIIAMSVCAVLVVQAIILALSHLRTRSWLATSAYTVVAILAAFGSIYFLRRALAFHAEAKHSTLHAPATGAPDFSHLGDGSQRIRNLEDIR